MTMTTEMTRTNGAQLAAPSPPPAPQADPRYALMPQGYAEAFSMASHFAKSGMFAAKSPEQAVVVLMTGMEMGLSPAMAMRGIDVIAGRPVPGAQTLMAACLARKDVCRFFTLVETTAERATYETHRAGASQPVTMSYTIAQAQQAGLHNKENWKKHTAEMLRNRCIAGLARAVYPDLCLGLYIPDEVESMAKPEGTARAEAPRPEPVNVTPPAEYAPNSEDALREARIRKRAEIVAAMGEIPADQRTAWLDRFESKWGLRNVKLLGLGQIDEALAAIDAKEWPYEAEFQAKRDAEKAEAQKTPADTPAEAAPVLEAALADEDDPFADAPALLDVPGAKGPKAEKGHGAS